MSALKQLSIYIGFREAPLGADSSSDSDELTPVQIISGIMTFSTGIFLGLARLAEPLFRVIIMQSIYQFFGQIYEPKLSDSKDIAELKAQD